MKILIDSILRFAGACWPALFVSFTLVASSLLWPSPTHGSSAKWRTSDPNCSPANRPRFEDDIEGYFDWWENCSTDETEAEPPPPLRCKPGERRRIESRGECWEQICVGGLLQFIPCEGSRPVKPELPRIQAIRLRTDGYTLLVQTRQGVREQRIVPKEVRLSPLFRAMVQGAKLPTEMIREVPGGFWATLPKRPARR